MDKNNTNNSLLRIGDGIVYHYTSLDTFFKILEGVKFDNLIFHASDVFTMNDPSEFIFGFRKLWNLMPVIENDLYSSIRKNNVSNINFEYLNESYRLTRMWRKLHGKEAKWIKTFIETLHQSYDTPFIVSFSCHNDFLPMWTTYGDNGYGVAIGLDVQSYYNTTKSSDNVTYIDLTNICRDDFYTLLVSYDDVKIDHPLARITSRYLLRYLLSISVRNGHNDDLFAHQLRTLKMISNFASSMIKNVAYKFESESRLVVNKVYEKDVNFKINSKKKILPYIQVGIPVSRMRKIVIGPCCEFNSVKMAIKTRLNQLNILLDDNDIVKSNIPYRG